MTERPFDSARFRQVLGHFPTGVTVVAGFDGDTPIGMAIGSFFSVSLDPPMVGFCVGRRSSTWPKLAAAGRFCVNVLAEDQEAISRSFGSRTGDKFAGVAWDRSPLGNPRLGGVAAWIDCEIDVVHQAGDHDVVIGSVHDLAVGIEAKPLVFFRGGYGL